MTRKGGRRGEVSIQMTACDLISLAVNVAQNGWSLDDLGLGSAGSVVFHTMLDEVYEQILEANRLAVEKRSKVDGSQQCFRMRNVSDCLYPQHSCMTTVRIPRNEGEQLNG